MKTTVSFVLDKTTPGAVRYQEVNAEGLPLKNDAAGAKINTLYLRKHWMGGNIPQKVTIELET